MALQMQPNFLSSIMGTVPEIDQGPMDLSAILQNSNLAPVAPGMQAAPQQVPPPRAPGSGRRSILDIVGGLGDVFATVGGATAQYRPQVDARNERTRQVDLDAMRRQQFEMQQRQGEQGLETGAFALDTAQRERMGQAARGLAAVYQRGGDPAIQKAWPILAQQLGIEPEKANIFGQALASDAQGTITALNAAMNPPANAGSLPREAQLYALAKQERPNLTFQEFLTEVQDKPTTDFQQAQILRDERRDRREDRRDREERAWRLDPRNPANIKAGAGGENGGVALTKTQLGNVNMKLRALPGLERQLGEVERLAAQLDDPNNGSAATGWIGGKVPGGLVGGIADRYDKAVASLQSQIRQFTKVPGEGSISDFETKLTGATLPSRSDSAAGRAQAASDLRALVTGIRTGYTEMAGTPAPRAGSRPAPRQRPAGKLSPRGGPTVSNW